MKQKIEIEVDVPDEKELTGEFIPGVCHDMREGLIGRLILRSREPVRESRWVNVYRETSYETLEKSNVGSGSHRQGVIRLDYENNKLVAVTLEPQ